MTFTAAAVSLLIVWAIGHYYAHTLERRVAARYPRADSGIILGAEEIRHVGTNGAAVLLVHGAGDTPQTMWRLADELHARGYSVLAPLLPGHGRSLAEFSAHTADDWYDETRRRHAELAETYSWVGVVGLSMGGALSARLAADAPDVPALVLASPYLVMPPLSAVATRTSWLWGLLVPYVGTASELSVLDPDARAKSLSYGAMSTSALRALRVTAVQGWRALARVRVPTLIIQSRSDNRVASRYTQRASELLGSTEKSIEWIDGAGHVITVDYGWQHVVKLIADWMDTHRR